MDCLRASLFGSGKNGANIWINVAGFSFQPGEVAKVMLVVAFTAWRADKLRNLEMSTEKK